MKTAIAYHPTPGEIKAITTLEANHFTTRDIGIFSVLTGCDELNIYLNKPPARIDMQADIVIIMGDDFAKRHPEPYRIYNDIEYFGKPKTVYPNPETPVLSEK